MTLIAELKRRKVVKAGAAYLVVAWLIVQAASIGFPAFDAPPWALRVFILIAFLGFPVALVLAWMLEVTPEGLKVEAAPVGNARMFAIAGALAVLAFVWYFVGQPSYRGDEAPAPGGTSVAVLPFANMSGKPDEEYFSDGMTEELLNVLARNPKLKVAARTSVFAYKNKPGDVREIGRTLGVGHILEGSVRREGGQVRITAQLVRVSDGFHVWSETFDRKLANVFALQDEIAGKVAGQLASSLGGAAVAATRTDVDPRAYDHYLKGRALYRDRRNMLSAMQHFRDAVALAPQFADAWANLALACEVSGYFTNAAQQHLLGDRIECMRDPVERAVALAPDAAITLHAKGNLARAEGRLADAERLFQDAIARDATYPDVREDYAELLDGVGRFDVGQAASRELAQLEPSVPLFWYRLVNVGISTGNQALIDEALTRILDLNPQYFYALTARFRQALGAGRIDDARRALDQAYAASPETAAPLVLLLRWSQGDSGIDARIALDLLETSYNIDFAALVAARGDTDLYFAVLGNPRVRDKRFDAFRQLRFPIAARMLADPRARQLLREAGFEAYWREQGWPAECRPLGDDDFACGATGSAATSTGERPDPT